MRRHFSLIKVDQLNQMESYFRAEVDKMLHLLQGLPDNQLKVEVLEASDIPIIFYVDIYIFRGQYLILVISRLLLQRIAMPQLLQQYWRIVTVEITSSSV